MEVSQCPRGYSREKYAVCTPETLRTVPCGSRRPFASRGPRPTTIAPRGTAGGVRSGCPQTSTASPRPASWTSSHKTVCRVNVNSERRGETARQSERNGADRSITWRSRAPIDGGVVGGRVVSDAVRHGLDEHRTRVLDAEGACCPDRRIRAEHIVAVHTDRRYSIAARCIHVVREHMRMLIKVQYLIPVQYSGLEYM